MMRKAFLSHSNHGMKDISYSVLPKDEEELVRIPTTFRGSRIVRGEFGVKSCTSAVKALSVVEKEERWETVDIVVTYSGLFIVQDKTDDVVMFLGNGTVAFACCEEDNARLWSIVIENKDTAPASYRIFVFHSGASNYKIEDLIETINKGVQGKYPGSLGVYPAKYNGSVSVDQASGIDVVNDAVRRLTALHVEPRAVEIVITKTQIRVMDAKTNDELKVFSIVEVSFTAIDGKDSKKLSFITNDARFGLLYCHAFSVEGGQAIEVPKTIGRAFDAATKILQTATKEELKEYGLIQATRGTSGALGVFEVKHIGSVPCKENNGNAVVKRALWTAKRQTKMTEMVILIISEDSIREIDGLTGEVNRSVLLNHVSFVTTIGDKKEIFGFISEDPRLKRLLSHLYECNATVAHAIVKTINDAFTTLVKKRQEEKNAPKNPFAASSKMREPAPGKLFACQLHRRDIKPNKVIGAGQFGQVYAATIKDKKVAVKTVRLAASEDDKEDFVREAEVMLELKSEGLVQLLGVAVQQRPWLCVIEFMKYGDLKDVLQTCKERNFEVSLWEQLKILIQVCKGLAFMAQRRYIHMDIAARNCLLAENNVCKLADFGLTRQLDKSTNRYLLKKAAKLPVRWVAIEALETGVFGEWTDVWAYGVLIWEVLSYGAIPFEAIANVDVKASVKAGTRLEQPPNSHDGLFNLAQTCWHLKRGQRPRFVMLNASLNAFVSEAKAKSGPERDIGKACMERESMIVTEPEAPSGGDSGVAPPPSFHLN